MELFNLLLISVSSLIMIIWALRKRLEIKTLEISLMEENDEEIDEKRRLQTNKMTYSGDKEILEKLADYFQKITLESLSKISKFVFILLFLSCFFVFYFLEEKFEEYAQVIFFFIGGYSQMIIINFIFRNYNFYDPRVIFLSRYVFLNLSFFKDSRDGIPPTSL